MMTSGDKEMGKERAQYGDELRTLWMRHALNFLHLFPWTNTALYPALSQNLIRRGEEGWERI